MLNVIFDLDGTLWDSSETILDAWKYVFNRYNIIDISQEDIKALLGLPDENIIKWISEKYLISSESAKCILQKCQDYELELIAVQGGKLYSGVRRTIQELSKMSNLYIVSNCQAGYIEAFLKYYNLQPFIKDFECAGNTKLNKSVNISKIINRNHIKNAIFIGDTESDRIASKENDLEFVYASYGFGRVKEYDYIINNFKDIKQLCYNVKKE